MEGGTYQLEVFDSGCTPSCDLSYLFDTSWIVNTSYFINLSYIVDLSVLVESSIRIVIRVSI